MKWATAKPLFGATILLLGAGLGHRWVYGSRVHAAASYRPLPASFTEIPSRLGPYTRVRDLELPPNISQVAGVDRFVYREYANPAEDSPILMYAGYWGRQNVGMGHGPEVCYPAGGWQPQETAARRILRFPSLRGHDPLEAAVALHHFARTEPEGSQRLAVGFLAVLDGRFVASSRGTFRHRPPRSPDEGFLAHVHVSTPVAGADWEAADATVMDFMERLLPHLRRCLLGDGSATDAHVEQDRVGYVYERRE